MKRLGSLLGSTFSAGSRNFLPRIFAAGSGLAITMMASNSLGLVHADGRTPPPGLNSPALNAALANAGNAPPPNAPPRKKKRRRRRKRKNRGAPAGLPYPGTFDNLDGVGSNCLNPNTFSGAKLALVIPVFDQVPPPAKQPKQVILNGTMSLGTTGDDQNADLAVQAQLGEKHVLVAGLASERISGRYIGHLGNIDINAGFSQLPNNPQYNSMDLNITHADKKSDLNASIYFSTQGIAVATYLQSITPTITLGVQGMHQFGLVTSNTYVARYCNMEGSSKVGDLFTLVLSDQKVAKFLYARQVDKNLALATELKYNHNDRSSEFKLGCFVQKNTFQFQGGLSSEGKIYSVLDQMVMDSFRFTLSGEMTHGEKAEGKFGIGLSTG